jgi:hypothetical protein
VLSFQPGTRRSVVISWGKSAGVAPWNFLWFQMWNFGFGELMWAILCVVYLGVVRVIFLDIRIQYLDVYVWQNSRQAALGVATGSVRKVSWAVLGKTTVLCSTHWVAQWVRFYKIISVLFKLFQLYQFWYSFILVSWASLSLSNFVFIIPCIMKILSFSHPRICALQFIVHNLYCFCKIIHKLFLYSWIDHLF